MVKKFCPNCGKENVEGSAFCPACGCKLKEEEDNIATVASGDANVCRPEDYVIEKRVLQKYTGNDVHLRIPDTVSEISSYTFSNFKTLKSVYIPASVSRIGTSAFKGCVELTSVTIENGVTEIGDNAFKDDIKLLEITIPDSVTKIGEAAFSECTNLTSVILGNGLTEIKNQAFFYCTKLKSISVPDSVKEIGSGAFKGCFELESISLSKKITAIGCDEFLGCAKLSSITIPDGVTIIHSEAFEGCTGLISIAIPDGVTEIRGASFKNCTGLSAITLPKSLTTIESNAFKDCLNLASITIPVGVKHIGNGIFDGCPILNIYYEGTTEDWGKIGFKDKTLIHCKDGDIDPNLSGKFEIRNNLLFEYKGEDHEVQVPKGVTTITGTAFARYKTGKTITSITLPNTIRKIEDGAFSGQESLSAIYYQGDVKEWLDIVGLEYLMLISDKSLYFNGIKAEKLIVPNGVTNIPPHAFRRCTELTSVVIPDSVTTIGYYAFRRCPNLTSVTLSESVKRLAAAFGGCRSLTSITIPPKVTKIENCMFECCFSLTTIEIPEGVSVIGAMAFEGDYASISKNRGGLPVSGKEYLRTPMKLTSITLPSTINLIEHGAFRGCACLKDIYYKGTKAQWKTLQKQKDWDADTGAYTVHCADGDIAPGLFSRLFRK